MFEIFATTHSIENVNAMVSAYSELDDIGDDLRLYRIEKENDIFNVINYNYEILKESLSGNWEVR